MTDTTEAPPNGHPFVRAQHARRERPKILLLGKLPPPYMGPALATQILLRSTLANRYDIVHVNSNVHDGLNSVGTAEPRKILKHARVYLDFLTRMWTSRPDVVVVPISQSTIGFLKDSVFILAARMLGFRVLVQLRGGNLRNWLREARPPTRAYVRGVLSLSDGGIVLGRCLRSQFEGILPAHKIFVVPNGANYRFGDKQAASDRVRILYLGNLQPSKGIDDVIGAVAQLREWGVGTFRLDVVGAWRDEETAHRCRRMVKDNRLPVVFHGPAYGAQKRAFLANADVFVFTPRAPEGHPWVIVEALAAGLPVVTTSQGAIPESVVDGRNGYVVEPENPREIAERLRELIENPELRRTQSRASRQHYGDNFTETHMVDRFSRAVEGVLTQQR